MTDNPSKAPSTLARSYGFRNGLRDGVPIGLGYLVVAFSLGIAARNAGLTAFQAALASCTTLSVGEYAIFTLVAVGAPYLEAVLMTLIANARYFLMGVALSQKMSPKMPFYHRLLLGWAITDEHFGIAVGMPGYVRPRYMYGAIVFSVPCWTLGTVLGVLVGNILPAAAMSAFSVALYGMFIAIFIPPARKNRVVAVFVLLSFVTSYAASVLPFLRDISSGTRTIILTLLLSVLAAVLFPLHEPEESDE